MDTRLYNILRGACTRTGSKPFDADEWPLDVGELLWRGLLAPTCGAIADVTTGGLTFKLTQRGRDAFKAEEKVRKQ